MSSLEDFLFISFQQENEMKKGKYLAGIQIFTFLREFDLFDVKDLKRNMADGNLIRKYV